LLSRYLQQEQQGREAQLARLQYLDGFIISSGEDFPFIRLYAPAIRERLSKIRQTKPWKKTRVSDPDLYPDPDPHGSALI